MRKMQFCLGVGALLLASQSPIFASKPSSIEDDSAIQIKGLLKSYTPTQDQLDAITPTVPDSLKEHFSGINPIEEILQKIYKKNEKDIKLLCYEILKLRNDKTIKKPSLLHQARNSEIDIRWTKFTTKYFKTDNILYRILDDVDIEDLPNGIRKKHITHDIEIWKGEFILRLMKLKPKKPFIYPAVAEKKEDEKKTVYYQAVPVQPRVLHYARDEDELEKDES